MPKCTILATNFQKSPSPGRSQRPSTFNIGDLKLRHLAKL